METQNPQEFNQRLNQWIASQGFWFQLRHSMSSGGGWSATLFHLMRLLVRIAIVLALVGLGFFYYLVKRVDSAGFRTSIRAGFEEALNASDAKISGFRRVQGQAMVRRVGATGTEESFFQSLEAGNLQFDMGFLDGVTHGWEAGVIKMNWLDAEIRAGANSEESGAAGIESVFAEYPGFVVQGLEVTNARLTWGYSERTFGGITGSRMVATRTAGGWRLRFRGGYFSQNWIRRFDIDQLVIFCSPDGLVVEEGMLSAGDGTVRFENVEVGGSSELPELSGTLIFERIPLSSVLPPNVHEMVEGSFSGEFEIGGSTNSTEGLTFSGSGNLDGPESISIRSELHLFEALDVVDVFNSYKRVDFDQGSFELYTQSGELVLSQLNLVARDLMEVQGRITVRRPQDDELERLFGVAAMADGLAGGLAAEKEKELRMSLKKAGQASKEDEENEAVDPEEVGFFDDIADERRLRRDAMDRARNLFVFDGGVRIMIPGDAFERSRELRERFPVDQASGRVGVDVPLQGTLGNITLELAEEILSRGASD
ncbi:hypothetical protein [Haloferula sp. A504]|uniref:hypothetical protein n=1 Tax=Haloferula sp. A504 TaxID=3373601 RepID=UPI0031C9A2BA|nr:hypothetical protein [Verrucomicrobiaceae bacterium E54]